jgi:hypothetical protein
MALSHIICSNPHSISYWSWKHLFTLYLFHRALLIRSWEHSFTSVPIHSAPQTISRLHQYYIRYNPHSTSHLSLKLPFTLFPIHIAHPIWSWEHHISSVPIHISPKITSWHHPLSFVLIHILLSIGRENLP